MSLIVIGTVALDSVKTPFGKADSILGGSATYFSVSASYFTNVSLVAVIGEDFPNEHLKVFEKHGINTSGLVTLPGKTFQWKGEYGFDLNVANTLDTQLNVLMDFNPTLTDEQSKTPYVFLGNIDPELQMKVIDQMKAPRLIALDSMNFWIENKKDALLEAIGKVNMVIINETEIRELTGKPSLIKAGRELMKMGPDTVIIKQGEYGAVAIYKDEVFSAPAYPMEDVNDPTGAGDTFAGGLMGYLSHHNEISDEVIRQAMIVGSIMASYNVEDFSLNRLTNLKFEDIAGRYHEIKRLTSFNDLRLLKG